jgi:hypothetical protein
MTAPRLNFPGMVSEKGRRYISPHTRVGMVFYPHADDPVFPTRSTDPRPVLWDIRQPQDAALQRFTWSKRLGAASGSWTASIKDNYPYQLDVADGDLMPGDWCDVTVLRNGVAIPVCRGIVDLVHLERRGSGGTRVREWTLSGRDHGAAMEAPLSFANIWIHTLEELTAGVMMGRVRGKIGGSPGEMFKTLLSAAFAAGTTAAIWSLPEGLAHVPAYQAIMKVSPMTLDAFLKAFDHSAGPTNLIDLLKVKVGSTRGGYYNEPVLWHQAGQSVHAALQDWCNPLLNEIVYDLEMDQSYDDTGSSRANLMAGIRERPFPLTDASLGQQLSAADGDLIDPWTGMIGTGMDSPWFSLPLWSVPAWCCPTISVGRSGMERFNLFELLADVGFGGEKAEQFPQWPPAWYRDSIKRHGLRGMIESTKYVGSADKAIAEWIGERKMWQKLLVQWYCLNPWFFSGSLQAHLMLPEIRVGHRLKLDTGNAATDETYYVEGVDLEYTRTGTGAPTCASSFTVTRGWRGDDRSLLKAISDVSSQYKEQR